MVAALRTAIRLRAARRARDRQVGTGGSPPAPPIGRTVRGETSAHGLTARELIRMAQAARQTRRTEEG